MRTRAVTSLCELAAFRTLKGFAYEPVPAIGVACNPVHTRVCERYA
jgi:hypothetical protein